MKRLIALATAVCLLLGGCSLLPDQPAGPGLWDILSQYVDGSMPSFSAMPYESPDPRALNDAFGQARTLAERGADAEELMDALDEAFSAYDEFYTMDVIAMIRSDSDQTDDYYRDEYARCEVMSAQVEQWYEQMLRACARSSLRDDLEDYGYFAPGDLDYYEQETTYDDALVALYQRESELVNEYRELRADDGVEIDGEQMSLDEYLARENLTEEEHDSAYLAWLERVNGEIARIYAELIDVRQQIADAYGYDSYEQFCYDSYGRDYTPAQANAYLEEIRRVLGPCREQLVKQGEYDKITYPALSEEELMTRLGNAMYALGSPAWDNFAFMQDYELCSVSADLNKAAVSYTVYLYSYNVPYLFVDAYGDIEDLMTVAHEFGHFLGANTQMVWDAPLDLDETWSQGMEFLALNKLYGQMTQYDALLRIKLLDALDTYTCQAAYAAFEAAAYELPPAERTAERFNELCLQCMETYGQAEDDPADALWWTQVDHLFEMPFYVVSYCVSADAAMQLYQMALEDPDAAWEAYQILLESWDLSYTAALASAGLDSPLTLGRAESARETIEKKLP